MRNTYDLDSLPHLGASSSRDLAYSRYMELARSTEEEKQEQIRNLQAFQQAHADQCGAAIAKLKRVALDGGNVFAELMETVKSASIGQITAALNEIGGQYRRNM